MDRGTWSATSNCKWHDWVNNVKGHLDVVSCKHGLCRFAFVRWVRPLQQPSFCGSRYMYFISLSCVQLFATPWTAARQASLSINSWSLFKLLSIESVMPSNHLILLSPSNTLIRLYSQLKTHHRTPSLMAQMVRSCLQCKRPKFFHSWVEKIPWRRARQPIPVFLPRESHRQRSLAGYDLWGHKDWVIYHTYIFICIFFLHRKITDEVKGADIPLPEDSG